MKLLIKKEFFDRIKKGKKTVDYREAHITFICEETGEKLRKKIKDVYFENKSVLKPSVKKLFRERKLVAFGLE